MELDFDNSVSDITRMSNLPLRMIPHISTLFFAALIAAIPWVSLPKGIAQESSEPAVEADVPTDIEIPALTDVPAEAEIPAGPEEVPVNLETSVEAASSGEETNEDSEATASEDAEQPNGVDGDIEAVAEGEEGEALATGLQSIQSIPLAGAADRFDLIQEGDRTLIAVGLLSEQAVAVIELETGEVLRQVLVGFAPHTVRYDSVNNRIYAAGIESDGLLVINPDDMEIEKGYGLVAGVLDIDFDPETKRIFATHPNALSISVMNLEEENARALTVPEPPLAIDYNSTSNNLFITMQSSGPLGLLVLDSENGELLALLRSGSNPEDIAIHEPSQRVVVLNSDTSDLTIIDRQRDGEAIDTVGLNWRPTRMVLSPDGTTAYITSRDSNRLQVVDLDNSQIEAIYDLGSSPIGLEYLPTPDGPGLLVVEAGEPSLEWVALPAEPPDVAIPNRIASGSAAGRIVDIAGNPVSGGEITLESLSGLTPDVTYNLLPDGSFVIPGLPEGVYLADISVPGFPTVSSQLQVRAGFISSTRIQLPPGRPNEDSIGIGIMPDREAFSDDLASHVHTALEVEASDRPVELLIGPIGVWEEFRQLAPFAQGLDIIDRDNRFTQDLEQLKILGNSLGLRYVILTHMDISRDYDTRGNPLLNLAVRYFVPQVPVSIPDFTPNELRSRGVMIVVDLLEDNPGDTALYFEAYGQDQVGGSRIFEDAAAGLFRRQAENMVPDLLEQWREAGSPLS